VRAPAAAGILALVGLACGSREGTGIIVEVNATPEVSARIDSVLIQVWNGDPGRPVVEETFPIWEGALLKLPAKIGLRPSEPDRTPTLRIEAAGLHGPEKQKRATAETTVSFRPSEVMRVLLTLGAYCPGGCAPEQICTLAGTCVPVAGDPPSDGGAPPEAGPDDAALPDTLPDMMSSPSTTGAPLGQSCRDGTGCQSGNCIDGICCDSSCQGPCRSCLSAYTGGTDGLCAPVASGRDPDSDCPAEPAATCRNAGGCDGAGACRLHPAGTPCAPSICELNRYTPTASCNGSGSCLPASPVSCYQYRCTSNGCPFACDSHDGCTDDAYCDRGRCVPRLSGGPCSGPRECAIGLGCVAGICL
jgi:hypothetical protein